jgi:hypothetical protein
LAGVAEEARTRGFAAPAFAGCALVEVWRYSKQRYLSRQVVARSPGTANPFTSNVSPVPIRTALPHCGRCGGVQSSLERCRAPPRSRPRTSICEGGAGWKTCSGGPQAKRGRTLPKRTPSPHKLNSPGAPARTRLPRAGRGSREDLLWLLDDAEQRRLLTLTPADLDGGRADWALALAQTFYRRGDRGKARAYADSAFKSYVPLIPQSLSDGDRAQLTGLQALALAYAGHTLQAVSKGEAALSAATNAPAWQRNYIRYLLARVHLIAGQSDQALDRLEQLVESRSGKVSPGFLRINGDFALLRGNPRFERLVNGS